MDFQFISRKSIFNHFNQHQFGFSFAIEFNIGLGLDMGNCEHFDYLLELKRVYGHPCPIMNQRIFLRAFNTLVEPPDLFITKLPDFSAEIAPIPPQSVPQIDPDDVEGKRDKIS